MDTNKDNLKDLFADVRSKSAEFATLMRRTMPSILVDVGQYSTDAFLLRSFVSLRCDNQGDELAMTINITAEPATSLERIISIESDLCLVNGTILVTGPSLQLAASDPKFEAATAAWNKEFDSFLAEARIRAQDVLTDMLLKKRKVLETRSDSEPGCSSNSKAS